MNNREHIDKLTDEALNSADGAMRATPRPYLMTRINARLQQETNSAWERAGRFIARPAVVIAGLSLIIGFNVLAIVFNNDTASQNTATAEQQATPDEFSNTVATLYDIENNEP